MTAPFKVVPEILFGEGTVEAVGPEARKRGATRALVVADPALGKAGLLERITGSLRAGGVEPVVFDEVEPEPWVETADRAGLAARKNKCDFIIGAGGGSAMDVAKAAAVLATNKSKARNYQGLGKVPKEGLPKMMVPTTAGTGSEVTFTAVLSRKQPKSKAGINSPFLFPEIAILDPALTVPVPPAVTASTGMDALTHAIESYTSKAASAMSDCVALQAIRLIAANLARAVSNGKDMEARSNMLMGSLLAGIGLANAGVGAVHALAYPLGGAFRIPHGIANGLLLSYLMRYNLAGAPGKFSLVAEAMGEDTEGLTPLEAGEKGVKAVEALAAKIGVPRRLSELKIEESAFGEMAEAALQVTRPLENNPRPVSREEAIAIYREAY